MQSENIDETNRHGYDAIASEFDDRRRPTTANFHELSRPFIQQTVARYRRGAKVLEVGPGSGFATELLLLRGFDLCLLELSTSMVSQLQSRFGNEIAIEVGSILCPPSFGNFDLIVCSLADPYLTKLALANINRFLKVGGGLVLTTPSKLWAEAVRKELGFTEFRKGDGSLARVHSFLYTNLDLRELLENSGFDVLEVQVAYGKGIKSTPISRVLLEAAESRGENVNELEVLQMVHAQRL